MNKKEAMAVIEPHINDIYKNLVRHPMMYAGHIECIQAFVMALEGILDFLSEGSERSNRFTSIIADAQWESEFFTEAFERQRRCQLGFIASGQSEAKVSSCHLAREFQEAFERHWNEFLKLRASDEEKESEGGTKVP